MLARSWLLDLAIALGLIPTRLPRFVPRRRALARLVLAAGLAVATLAGGAGPAAAQSLPGLSAPKADEAKPAEKPKDPLGRETPEGMVNGLLNAIAAQDFERAAKYLNTQDIPSWRRSPSGYVLASMLQKALDRAGYLDGRWLLSNDLFGKQDDGLPPNVDRIGAIRTTAGTVDLLAERVEGREPVPVWLVSSDTLARLPDLLRTAVSGPLDKLMPAALADRHFAGAPVGHWLALLVLAVVGYGVAYLVSLGIKWVAVRVLTRLRRKNAFAVVEAADQPLRILLTVGIFLAGGFLLGVSIVARERTSPVAAVVGWAALAWFLWRAVDVVTGVASSRAAMRGHFAAISIISLLRRTGKLALVALGVILSLDTFGVDVTAGLAALGIGGIAIALGAQKTVENFIGSLTIIADQPMRVGDFCKFGDTVGTVEDIGIRSSRIRTNERTVVTVPNSIMSSSTIENYSRRDRFWFHPTLTLRYETTPDQVRYLLVRLREMLYAHPKVSPDPARVRFVGFGADSLNLEIFAYVLGDNFDDFLEVQEDLLLRIMDIVQQAGAAFAFASRTLYMARDSKADEGAAREAEARVRDWAGRGELPLPRFSPERIAALRGTSAYPAGASSGTMRKAAE